VSQPYTRTTAIDLATAVNAGRERAVELAAAAEAEQRRWESATAPLGAFVSVDFGAAAEAALALEDGLREGDARLPLAGVPVAVKDNLSTADLPTTCGSRLLETYRAPFDATVVRRLRAAGAMLVGKTNLDEFAMGSSTEHSAFGPTRHPLDAARVPGGSSGGSAAAVAAGIVPCALGSDTGGSVRQPAAFCGIVGIKPTYGMVSRYGLVAFAPSLDTVGTMARTVADAALLLECIAGHDPLDSTSPERDVPELRAALGKDVREMTIGVPAEYFPGDLHPGVNAACRAAVERLEALGARIRPVSLPHTGLALPAYHVLSSAEASSSLSRFDGVRFGVRGAGAASAGEVWERTRALFGREARRRILLGTFVLAAGHRDRHYARAQAARARVAADFANVFGEGVDAVLTPTTPTPAFRLGEHTDPYAMSVSDSFTVAASLAGLPALTLPVGTADGLPVGAQLIGPAWSEPRLVRIADALERALASPSAGARASASAVEVAL
jgi:aspartyl-tRNA(Asn)/glutamyl-tRNA(Gln) amidotransferase subunit A